MTKNNFENKIIYLAAPKRLFETKLYTHAYEYLEKQSPFEIKDSRFIFRSNQEWKTSYKHMIHTCDIMVIVSDESYEIGKGVYDEYCHFRRTLKKPVYCFRELLTSKSKLEYQGIMRIKNLMILNEQDYEKYALIELE